MAKKFLLNPVSSGKICVHPESGIAFKIRPISVDQHEELRRTALRADKSLDIPKWGAGYAVAAIADWSPREGKDDAIVADENGAVECTEANLRIFGRQQCLNIMTWISEQATGLTQFEAEEESAAKNV